MKKYAVLFLIVASSFQVQAQSLSSFAGCWQGTAQATQVDWGSPKETLACNKFNLKIGQIDDKNFAFTYGCSDSADYRSDLNYAFATANFAKLKDGALEYHYFNFDGETRYDAKIEAKDKSLIVKYEKRNDEDSGIDLTSSNLVRVACP